MADADDHPRLILPKIPEQLPGNQFQVTANNKIGVAVSGLATDADLNEIGELKLTLLEALDDLLQATEKSNPFQTLHTVAKRYKSAIDLERPSIDALFGRGLRFERAIAQLRAEIASGDLPKEDFAIAEALDSVVAIHGTVIQSTQRSQVLVGRSNEYARTLAQESDLAPLRRPCRFAGAFSLQHAGVRRFCFGASPQIAN